MEEFFVSNCPAYPHVDGLKSVSLAISPPNTTAQTQPVDQGAICTFKAYHTTQLRMYYEKFTLNLTEAPYKCEEPLS